MRGNTIRGEDAATDINISPLIDMVFILLIFFIVTTVFVEESGLGIETPVPLPSVPLPDNEPFVLKILEGGSVYRDGKEIGVGGVEYAIRNAQNRGLLDSVTIEAHPLAKVAYVAAVLDVCSKLKVEKVVTKTSPK